MSHLMHVYAPECGTSLGFCTKRRGRAAVPMQGQQGAARQVPETAVVVSPRELTTYTELARIKRNQPRRWGDSGASVQVLSSQHKVDHWAWVSDAGTTQRGCAETTRLFLQLRRNYIKSRASVRSSNIEPHPGSSGE